MKMVKFIVVLTLLFMLISCPDYNNPIDPEAEDYQGFLVYEEDSIPEGAVISVSGVSPEVSASTFDTTPLLSWDNIANAEGYQLQIAGTSAGLADAELITLTVSQYQIPIENILELGNTYYWHIRITSVESMFSPWSNIFNFTVSGTVSWAGISPVDGGSTTDTTPLLEWDDVTGANGYKVRYANSSGGLDAATVYDATASEYPITVVQVLDSNVYWQVRAVNGDGVNSAWSSEYSFTVDWDISWNGLDPSNGGWTPDTTPLLAWDDVTEADGYKVRYANSSGGLDAATVYGATASEYQVTVVQALDSNVYWQVLAVNEDGVDSVWSSVWNFEVREPLIGEAFGGGIVFYVDGAGGGLIAAESDQGINNVWGGYGTDINGDNAAVAPELTAVGTGAANTAAIVAAFGESEPYGGHSNYAAKLCDDLVLNGYDDWFLPSKDELDLMYGQKGVIGGFAGPYYWSSSEYNSSLAWYQYFSNGDQYSVNKFYDTNFRVRAVRAF